MAYAALVSLAQKLEQIHQDPHHILHYLKEEQYFKTLYQSVVELQDTLEKIPEKSQQQITICANEAEDMMDQDCYVSHSLPTHEDHEDMIDCYVSHRLPAHEDMMDCYVSHRLPTQGGCCGLTSCLMEILLCAATYMFPHYRIGDKDELPHYRIGDKDEQISSKNYRIGDKDEQISCKNSTNLHQKLQKVTADIISMAEEAKKVEGSGDEIEHLQVSGSLFIAEEAKKVEGSGDEIEHVQVPGSLPSPSSSKTRQQVRKYSRNRSQLRGEDSAVGFDEDLKEIKSRLREGPSRRQIIPIVGMGGAGKTTLARILYHDRLIVERFDVRAWITVSQNYDLREILLWLLVDIKGSSRQDYDGIDNERLGVEVYRSLKARRYLIVIDDIWSETFWDDVHNLLPDDHNRSRILLTTRLSHVATYADCTSAVHYLQLLGMDHSWSLLEEKVFGQATCPPVLEVIGKSIARKCGGLPLAIVVMAGILAVNRNHDSWKSIARNVNSGVISNGDHQILEILSLSYSHLPHHLRACFLYAGSFPEDYDIPVTRLIMLWTAEGFLKPSRSQSPEELAYGYVEDLAKRNLIFVSRRRSNGRIRSLRIHDSMRDSCVKIAHREKFLYLTDNYYDFIGKGIISPRRLAIYSDTDSSMEDLYSPSSRSALSFRFRADLPVPVETFKLIRCRSALYFRCQADLPVPVETFKLIRVLDALTIVFRDFSSQICQLVFLRYLAFSHNNKNLQLPSAIGKLTELQTLLIKATRKYYSSDRFILYLPRDIWKMPQLRHLIFWQNTIMPIPSEKKTLVAENLQTLSQVMNLKFTRQVLEMIPNIRKLGICYWTEGSYQQWPDYCLDNLEHLLQLQTLSITVLSLRLFRICEKIKLPESLKKLSLTWSRIPWEDLGRIAGYLPNLEVLKLKESACNGETWETKQGEFPKLKMLEINATWPDTWITEDSSHFPNLERLCIFNWYGEPELPECIGEIGTLQSIEVDEGSKFLIKWAKAIQEEQVSMGNEIQVLIHPGIPLSNTTFFFEINVS